ncbi:SAM-dependent methyltransferase [Polynucleobacter sphagniphilus]|uniref:class I SAM-dependent methyltransferase n=1 Tax=Polynucleobacter sphagniphilus TaxID=1743169 RepID=UPI00247409D2|nr:class I SAM-dependent methyltransferase [Polynucleobacter sphagniphilus]MDH6154051.1 SAM-dependent methyltransferase [Polynucleobacter sphagniphilus]
MKQIAFKEMSTLENQHWWFVSRRLIIFKFLESINIKKNANILEIGCGTGGNLNMLSNFGNVSGMEMNEEAKKFAEEVHKNKYEVRLGSSPHNITYDEVEKFELCCLFDVLEHIEEDTQTLECLKRILKPNGIIVITVPAYQWLFGPHDLILEHKRRYTKKELIEKSNKAGLELIRSSYFNTLLFPAILFFRIIEKVNGDQKSTVMDRPNKIINNLLKAIFSLEYRVLKKYNLPYGASIIAAFKIKNNA